MKWALDNYSLYLLTNKFKTPPLAIIVQINLLSLYYYLVNNKNNKIYFVRAIRLKNDAINNISYKVIYIIIESFLDAKVKYNNRSTL